MMFTIIYLVGYLLTWRTTVAYIAWDAAYGGNNPDGTDWFMSMFFGSFVNLFYPLIYLGAGVNKLYKRSNHGGSLMAKLFPKPKVMK